jgi:hypothetical protein
MNNKSPKPGGTRVVANSNQPSKASAGQADSVVPSLPPFLRHELPRNDRQNVQQNQLGFAWDLCDGAQPNREHVLLPGVDCVLPGWMRCVQGFEMLCKSAAPFQTLAQLRDSAATGQAVPVKDTDTPERDALFSELAKVAGPGGWQDETIEVEEEGTSAVYVPRGRMLQLLEDATTHLEAINWEWEHALPRAAFLVFCIARIVDDKRTSQVIESLPPGQEDLPWRLNGALVRSPWTAQHCHDASFRVAGYSPAEDNFLLAQLLGVLDEQLSGLQVVRKGQCWRVRQGWDVAPFQHKMF